MDPRKQKRLGPAPIASFEKSFEDSTTTQAGVSLPTAASTETTAINRSDDVILSAASTLPQQDINRNAAQMESHELPTTKPVTAASVTLTTTHATETTNIGTMHTPHHTTDSQSPAAKYEGVSTTSYKRPPPLKAATAGATTTLVSSGEQQLITYRGVTTLMTPSTPRIELSRASSSSHHEEDSRESSPENVFDQVGTGTLQETIELGFREEGALELRSSTEELFFMDPEQKKEEQEKIQQQGKRSSPHIFRFEEHQSYLQQHQRKDSASSEVAALLCISGRTSRISSVGSQGSAVSRLSAVSGVSRSPSPHRMLLETSFCGPKPLDNIVDGRCSAVATEPQTAELLEQAILARKQDPTKAVFAEGIHVESSPKKKPTSLSNGDTKLKAKIATQNQSSATTSTSTSTKASTLGAQRHATKSPGQMVVGKTPSGTEYIRINLKPNHMYEDNGIAPNERIVEAPNVVAPVYARGQKKPVTLSLGAKTAMDETRLTPTASPKPSRRIALGKEVHASRSPSPATISISRKSSFSSLFRFGGGGGKDSPDSPREKSRSRSKSKERQAAGQSQSQNVTPNKQKSVLAIFKTGKRGSSAGATGDSRSSKSSSPIDTHDPHSHSNIPKPPKAPIPPAPPSGSRPPSRLRYYDEPVEGYIHIPLHTPPEEKETRKLLEGIQKLNEEPPPRPVAVPITQSQLAAAAAALKPVGVRKNTGPKPPPKPQQADKMRCAENLDAIHTLPHDDADADDHDNKERSWGMAVQLHGPHESHAIAPTESVQRAVLNVRDKNAQENSSAAEAEIHRLPSVESTTSACEARIVETVATVNTAAIHQEHQESFAAREKRRLLFATRLGSGSEEQIFSTQFSISKTESQSSQLSEKVHHEAPADSTGAEHLQRQATVIRRHDESDTAVTSRSATKASSKKPPLRTQRQKSISTSEDEPSVAKAATVAVIMRRKGSCEESPLKLSGGDEDARITAAKLAKAAAAAAGSMATQRHSRYLENFDVRKKLHENLPPKPDQSLCEEAPAPPQQFELRKPTPILPQPPPPTTAPSPSPPGSHSAAGSRTPTPPARPTSGSVRQRSRSQSQSPDEGRARQMPTKPPRTTTPVRRSQSAATASSPSPPLPATSTATATCTATATSAAEPSLNRPSMPSTDDPVESSESERDSDLAAASSSAGATATAIDLTKRHHLPRHASAVEDHESAGLVSQESFDDELPYIPTTLPEERAHGVCLIPMKERAHMEVKTCPVDRPRSTTPLNPSHLEEYYGIATTHEPILPEHNGTPPVRGEKLRISLPRKDPLKEPKQSAKSPRRSSNSSGKSWFEFAEEGLRAVGGLERKDSNKQLLATSPPQPQPQFQAQAQTQHQHQPQSQPQIDLQNPRRSSTNTKSEQPKMKIPTKAITNAVQSRPSAATTANSCASGSTQRKLSGHWIDFENIPEKRKHPRRITTLPKEGSSKGNAPPTTAITSVQHHSPASYSGRHSSVDGTRAPATIGDGKLHYNYVKPEDCQCECHEVERESSGAAVASGTTTAPTNPGPAKQDDSMDPNCKPKPNVEALPQGEDLLPLLDPDTHDGIDPSDSSREYSCYTDDEAEMPFRQSGSSRSRSSSSKADEFPRRDITINPRHKKFPDKK